MWSSHKKEGPSSDVSSTKVGPGMVATGYDFDETLTASHFHAWLQRRGVPVLPTVYSKDDLASVASELHIALPEPVAKPMNKPEKPDRPWKSLPHRRPTRDDFYDSDDPDKEERMFQEAVSAYDEDYEANKEAWDRENAEAEVAHQQKLEEYEVALEQYALDTELHHAQVETYRGYLDQMEVVEQRVLDMKAKERMSAKGVDRDEAIQELQGEYLEKSGLIDQFLRQYGMKNQEFAKNIVATQEKGHMNFVLSYTQYPGGVKPLMKKGYGLPDDVLAKVTVVGGFPSAGELRLGRGAKLDQSFGKELHFKSALERNGLSKDGLRPDQMIMVDDSSNNVQVAVGVGHLGLLVKKGSHEAPGDVIKELQAWTQHSADELPVRPLAKSLIDMCQEMLKSVPKPEKGGGGDLPGFGSVKGGAGVQIERGLKDVINRCSQKLMIGMAITEGKIDEYLTKIPPSMNSQLEEFALANKETLDPSLMNKLAEKLDNSDLKVSVEATQKKGAKI